MKELPDIKLNIEDYFEYQNIELLNYVWEVTNHFLPNIGDAITESKVPAIFYKRYHQRNLSIEEKYKMFYISNQSFEDYLKSHSDNKPLKDSFKERYLNNRELQNTIEAFGL